MSDNEENQEELNENNNNDSANVQYQAPATNSLTILGNIFTSPAEAMEQIQESYSVMLPLLTLMAATVAVFVYYYVAVDYQWYIEHMVEMSAGDLSKSEQEQTRAGMEMMSQNTMGGIASISAAIGLAIVFVIQAVYYVIVSNITNDGFQFKQWMSFVTWTSMPALFVYLAMVVYIFTSSNGQIPFESLNPISLNELFFNLDPTVGLGKMLGSLDLTKFWSMYIMIIGYQKWTGKSMQASATVVLIPFVAIYGIWALMM